MSHDLLDMSLWDFSPTDLIRIQVETSDVKHFEKNNINASVCPWLHNSIAKVCLYHWSHYMIISFLWIRKGHVSTVSQEWTIYNREGNSRFTDCPNKPNSVLDLQHQSSIAE